MSRYLARLASRVQAAPVAPRAPVAGLDVERVSVREAPAATAAPTAGATPPPPVGEAVTGLPPSPAVQRAVPRAAALERVDEQVAVPVPVGSAAASVTAAARAPGVTTGATEPPPRAVDAHVVVPTQGAARELPAPAAAGAEARAPQANLLAPRPAGSEPAALGPVARGPELAGPPAAPKRADPLQRAAPPERATVPAPQPTATWPAAAPRGLATERARPGAPQVEVHIGSVQLTVRAPAAPAPAPRTAPAPRAEAKQAFSAHRHYLRVG